MRKFQTLLATGAFFLLTACQSGMNSAKPERPDINAVLNAHSAELMAKPGVVGVYVGLLPDEKTPCIKVMLKSASVPVGIPKTLEGHPVRTEMTGEIRPLPKKQ
jgi:hypothetical protein